MNCKVDPEGVGGGGPRTQCGVDVWNVWLLFGMLCFLVSVVFEHLLLRLLVCYMIFICLFSSYFTGYFFIATPALLAS